MLKDNNELKADVETKVNQFNDKIAEINEFLNNGIKDKIQDFVKSEINFEFLEDL